MASAAILIGGRAARFSGEDKSRLVVGGQTILDRQLAALEGVADDVMLVGGTTTPIAPAGTRWIPDRRPGSGPLGGLDAALAAARDAVLVLLACDMPFVTGGLLRYLVEQAAAADAVVPRTERGYHPLCAVYTRACAPAVSRRLERGELKMLRLLDDLRVTDVTSGSLARWGGAERLLTNVNSPATLGQIEAPLGHNP